MNRLSLNKDNLKVNEEATLKKVLKNSFALTLIINQEGNIQFVTDHLVQLLEYRGNALIDTNIFNYIHPTQRQKAIDKITGKFESKENQEYSVFKFKTPSGQYKHLSIKSFNHCKDPVVKGFMINVHDVSSIVKAEKEKYFAFIDTKEDERNRISIGLHEGVGQTIAAANMYLNYLDAELINKIDKETYLKFKTVIGLVSDAVQKTRLMSHNFMPQSLKQFGLKEGIKNLISNHQSPAEQLSIQFNSDIHEKRYSNRIETFSFRVLQELFNNAIKHSEASKIKISIKDVESQLILEVIDNGIGFNPTQTKRNNRDGIGLLSLRQSVKALGGSLHIKSNTTKGTSITKTINI